MSLREYDFEKGDLVTVLSMVGDDVFPSEGEILERRFAACSLDHRRVLPHRYYVVMLQENHEWGGEVKTMGCMKLEVAEARLERFDGPLETVAVDGVYS